MQVTVVHQDRNVVRRHITDALAGHLSSKNVEVVIVGAGTVRSHIQPEVSAGV